MDLTNLILCQISQQISHVHPWSFSKEFTLAKTNGCQNPVFLRVLDEGLFRQGNTFSEIRRKKQRCSVAKWWLKNALVLPDLPNKIAYLVFIFSVCLALQGRLKSSVDRIYESSFKQSHIVGVSATRSNIPRHIRCWGRIVLSQMWK